LSRWARLWLRPCRIGRTWSWFGSTTMPSSIWICWSRPTLQEPFRERCLPYQRRIKANRDLFGRIGSITEQITALRSQLRDRSRSKNE
jgi:hypothetical protein